MKTKVLLVDPPTRRQNPRPPLGLMYISSYLTSRGIENDIIDLKTDKDEESAIGMIVQSIREKDPEFIGISCMTSDVKSVLRLATEIKKKVKARIILGGIHPTLFPREMLAHDCVDFVVMGEGEKIFHELVTSKDPSKLENIGYRKGKKIIINRIGTGNIVENLDELPFPAFDKVNMEFYLRVNHFLVRGVPLRGTYVIGSRGCPYRCSFCVNKNLFNRRIRYRSPKNIADEVEFLYRRYKIDAFYLSDDTFAARKDHALEFCDELMRRKLPIVWGCETRVNLISEDLIARMKKARCIQIDIGVEAGNQKMLDHIMKDITMEQVRKALLLCKKYGIRVFSNFMINLPDETEQDLRDTIGFARSLKSNVSVFNITCPFPGTDIYNNFDQELTIDDYDRMASMESFRDYVQLIESKCRLSRHRIPIDTMLEIIAREVPTPRSLSLRIDSEYVSNLLRYFDFITNRHYWSCLLRSRNKKEYMRYLFSSSYLKYFKYLILGTRVRKD